MSVPCSVFVMVIVLNYRLNVLFINYLMALLVDQMTVDEMPFDEMAYCPPFRNNQAYPRYPDEWRSLIRMKIDFCPNMLKCI